MGITDRHSTVVVVVDGWGIHNDRHMVYRRLCRVIITIMVLLRRPVRLMDIRITHHTRRR